MSTAVFIFFINLIHKQINLRTNYIKLYIHVGLSNFYPLEVVSSDSESQTQLKMGKNQNI